MLGYGDFYWRYQYYSLVLPMTILTCFAPVFSAESPVFVQEALLVQSPTKTDEAKKGQGSKSTAIVVLEEMFCYFCRRVCRILSIFFLYRWQKCRDDTIPTIHAARRNPKNVNKGDTVTGGEGTLVGDDGAIGGGLFLTRERATSLQEETLIITNIITIRINRPIILAPFIESGVALPCMRSRISVMNLLNSILMPRYFFRKIKKRAISTRVIAKLS